MFGNGVDYFPLIKILQDINLKALLARHVYYLKNYLIKDASFF